jgi:glucoamylase
MTRPFRRRSAALASATAFAATAQDYAFGVCAPGAAAPICSADPATVPKVLDTITPPGLPQSAELDPSLGPVTLQGITAP